MVSCLYTNELWAAVNMMTLSCKLRLGCILFNSPQRKKSIRGDRRFKLYLINKVNQKQTKKNIRTKLEMSVYIIKPPFYEHAHSFF